MSCSVSQVLQLRMRQSSSDLIGQYYVEHKDETADALLEKNDGDRRQVYFHCYHILITCYAYQRKPFDIHSNHSK